MSNVFIFNPTGELALANGTNSYMPPKNLRVFERDLSFIPAYFAAENDSIIMDKAPDREFIDTWQQLGLPKLNYTSFDALSGVTNINSIKPWSWNQVLHNKFRNIKEKCSDDFKASPNFIWNQDHKHFFSRNTTNEVQEYIFNQCSNHPFVGIKQAAINIYSIEEFEEWTKLHPNAILKMPWSSSGRGIHVINPKNKQPANYQWIQGALNQQKYLTAEPLLDKVFDFSSQLEVKRNGAIKFKGYSFFINDSKGHFIGGNINWPHKKDDISQFLTPEVLEEAMVILTESLKTVQPHLFYEGHIGIDAIVYNDLDRYKIHPCVDINWRYNMGVVNINIPRFVQPHTKGYWKTGSFKKGEWNSFIEHSKKTSPLILNHNKIESGFLNMTPPNKEAQFGVWLEVGQ